MFTRIKTLSYNGFFSIVIVFRAYVYRSVPIYVYCDFIDKCIDSISLESIKPEDVKYALKTKSLRRARGLIEFHLMLSSC